MVLARYCILVNVITFITCAEIQNPCQNPKILEDDGSRRRSCSYSTGKCDRYLMPDWYRVKLGKEDLMMPTDPPTIDSCGTHYPIWLNGEHPVESDGIVDRVGCSTYMNTKCNSRYKIKIKNCTDYMVYYLVRAFGCNERYCFEGNNVSNGGKCGPSTLLKTTTTTSTLATAQNPSTPAAPNPTTTSPTSQSFPTSNPKSTAASVPTTLPNDYQGLNYGIVNNGNSRSDQHISNDDKISEKDDGGVPISAFIAMAVLSIVLIIVIVLLIFYMVYKKRDRNQGNLEKYIIFEPVSDLGCKNI